MTFIKNEQTDSDPLDDYLSGDNFRIFMNAAVQAARSQLDVRGNAAISEFAQSGLSPSEFNARHYREDGEIFPVVEDGQMKLISVIRMPEDWGVKRKIAPEKVLKLYNENFSIQEIATTLKRSEKWVRKSLSHFGIKFDRGGLRFNPADIPFGWSWVNGKFVINSSEQWVLEKAEEDFRRGKSLEEVCRLLNDLRIKPRYGKLWIEPMVSKTISINGRLKTLLLR